MTVFPSNIPGYGAISCIILFTVKKDPQKTFRNVIFTFSESLLTMQFLSLPCHCIVLVPPILMWIAFMLTTFSNKESSKNKKQEFIFIIPKEEKEIKWKSRKCDDEETPLKKSLGSWKKFSESKSKVLFLGLFPCILGLVYGLIFYAFW